MKLLLIGLLVAATSSGSKIEVGFVRSKALICMSPCSFKVFLRVKPDENNRWAVVEVDGPEFHGTTVQLTTPDGATKQSMFEVPFTLKGVGDYTVVGVLYNTSGEVDRNITKIQVKGFDGE